MRKQLPVICVAAGIVLLAACTNDGGQQQTTVAPQPAVCNGPTVEISGAEPRYEPLNPTANQDYQRDGKSYKIVQDPSRFSQAGLAAIYDAEPGSNLTASGEMFDPMQLTAAHPTLPIPSYARITNLANGRMIVVRINDRGPYGTDRVISLSRAAADRLNTSNNTKVRIDPIIVAPDGSLSGPGMACTTVAKQTYALPPRPDLSGGMGSASSAPAQPQGDVLPVSNSTLKSDDTTGAPVSSSGFLGAPVSSSGFLGAPTTLAPGVLEGNEPTPAPQPAPVSAPVAAPATATPVSAPAAAAPVSAPVSAPATAASGRFVVQVGAVSDQTRAQQYQQRLSQQFSVPGRVIQNGAVWRIQLGPFASKAEASALQQRLQTEAQLQSFIASAQ
ncbi:TPA: endolytic peptidoglycan transglycosylase RlpA [Salmonella enterica subsp. enterica serovar Enteritidis]|nr:endolytic peptidoglycan transglycosylase RlpA [Salmonella enterica subsp. enterica serovar Enteritidis]